MLVHYRDLGGAEADLRQWDDRLWVFERTEADPEALRWTEYPVVDFDDGSGRFRSALGANPVRELGYWEPDAGQRREIERGLEAGSRGARHRTLRRIESGWSSETGSGARYDSARFVTWSTVFEIELGGDAPVFTVRDALGSAAARAIEGRTLYRGERVLEDGHVIEGAYDRDGKQLGRFRMTRSGGRRVLEEPAAEPAPGRDEVYERFYTELGRQLRSHDALPERARPEDATAEGRRALRARVRGEVETLYRAQGNDPQPHAPQVERLSAEITRLYTEGRSRDEIGRAIQEGDVRP